MWSGEGPTLRNFLGVRVIKTRSIRWAGYAARMEEVRSSFKILTGKPTGKRLRESLRGRWKDNIRIDLKEVTVSTRGWVDSTQNMDYWRAFVNEECGTSGSISHGVT